MSRGTGGLCRGNQEKQEFQGESGAGKGAEKGGWAGRGVSAAGGTAGPWGAEPWESEGGWHQAQGEGRPESGTGTAMMLPPEGGQAGPEVLGLQAEDSDLLGFGQTSWTWTAGQGPAERCCQQAASSAAAQVPPCSELAAGFNQDWDFARLIQLLKE